MGLVVKQGPQKHSKLKKHTITIEVNAQIMKKRKCSQQQGKTNIKLLKQEFIFFIFFF